MVNGRKAQENKSSMREADKKKKRNTAHIEEKYCVI